MKKGITHNGSIYFNKLEVNEYTIYIIDVQGYTNNE